MKHRIRTIIRRCGFVPFAFLLSCTPAQQQKAKSAAEKIAATSANREAVCELVRAYASNETYAERLKEAVQLCDAQATVQDIINTLDTDDEECAQ